MGARLPISDRLGILGVQISLMGSEGKGGDTQNVWPVVVSDSDYVCTLC